MDKIPTALELLVKESRNFEPPLTGEKLSLLVDLIANQHARNHVKAALNSAANQAQARENPSDYGTGEIWVDKQSILKAYPENLIQ